MSDALEAAGVLDPWKRKPLISVKVSWAPGPPAHAAR
jgi:hypothetical protein